MKTIFSGIAALAIMVMALCGNVLAADSSPAATTGQEKAFIKLATDNYLLIGKGAAPKDCDENTIYLMNKEQKDILDKGGVVEIKDIRKGAKVTIEAVNDNESGAFLSFNWKVTYPPVMKDGKEVENPKNISWVVDLVKHVLKTRPYGAEEDLWKVNLTK